MVVWAEDVNVPPHVSRVAGGIVLRVPGAVVRQSLAWSWRLGWHQAGVAAGWGEQSVSNSDRRSGVEDKGYRHRCGCRYPVHLSDVMSVAEGATPPQPDLSRLAYINTPRGVVDQIWQARFPPPGPSQYGQPAGADVHGFYAHQAAAPRRRRLLWV